MENDINVTIGLGSYYDDAKGWYLSAISFYLLATYQPFVSPLYVLTEPTNQGIFNGGWAVLDILCWLIDSLSD